MDFVQYAHLTYWHQLDLSKSAIKNGLNLHFNLEKHHVVELRKEFTWRNRTSTILILIVMVSRMPGAQIWVIYPRCSK